MSIEVYLTTQGWLRDPGSEQSQLSIEVGGAFWYLWSHTKCCADERGRSLDPFGDAFFRASSLASFSAHASSALADLNERPDPVFVAVAFTESGEPVLQPTSHREIQDLLERLLAICAMAESNEQGVLFVGD